jgi:isopentenyldiphosphate isomerase
MDVVLYVMLFCFFETGELFKGSLHNCIIVFWRYYRQIIAVSYFRHVSSQSSPAVIQAFVYLHVVDKNGHLYLQKRAHDNARFPGRWDTRVGGYVVPGETPEAAIRREAREELDIDLSDPAMAAWLRCLDSYIYAEEVETEYVVPYRLVYSGTLGPNPEEVED